MSKRARSGRSQSKHDRKVRALANKHDKRRNKVRADVDGYPQPETKFGRRPDVFVEHQKGELLYEVETEDSIDTERAKKQHQAFRNWESRGKNRNYKRIIV